MKVIHQNSPKAGLEEHLRPDTARVLIAAGLAREVPFPKRGSAGWLEAMAEVEKLRVSNSMDTKFEFVKIPTWEIITLPITGKPAILLRSGFEVTRFTTLHWYDSDGEKHDVEGLKDCPKHIKQHFEEVLIATSPEAIEAANERALIARQNADRDAKTGSNRYMRKLGIEPNLA